MTVTASIDYELQCGQCSYNLPLPKTPYFRLYIDLRLQAEQGYRCYRRRR